MRWLAHRGGALDFREFALKNPGKPYPVAVVLGAANYGALNYSGVAGPRTSPRTITGIQARPH